MATRRPLSTWLFAALLLSVPALLPAACLFAPEYANSTCGEDPTVCDDGNPCTKDTCGSDGFCTSEPDDSIVPDDLEECTTDACVEGEEQHTPNNGTTCGVNKDLTCEAGKCKCQTASQCGEDTACLTFECNGVCVANPEADGTIVPGGVEGDCQKTVCQGGKVATAVDEADFPLDSVLGDCKKPSCNANGELVTVPEMTDVPPDETQGDCQQPACNASGQVVSADNPDDAPLDDNNPCTEEGCSGGTVIDYQPVADGTACGETAKCVSNGIGFSEVSAATCQGGACAAPMSTSCNLYACNGDKCHTSCTTSNDCIANSICDASGLCVPDSTLGKSCTVQGDCTGGTVCVDKVCCNEACSGTCQRCDQVGAKGVCVNIPSGQDPADECPGNATCNGSGACASPLGEACATDSNCLSGQCENSVCCDVDCTGDCKTCNQPGNVGTCQNVTAGQTVGACSGALACNGNGLCKKANGETCNAAADCASGFCSAEGTDPGICCNTVCSGTCQSCMASKNGGTTGVCGFITNKTDPDSECPGMCKTANGSACCNGAGACNP